MLGIAFMVGWTLCLNLAEKEGYDRKVCGISLVAAIIGSLLGARIFFFWSATSAPLTFENFFAFSDGGMVAYGGYIGGFLFCYTYLKWKKVPFWSFIDCAAPTLGLGLGIVRVGCFLYGCDYGVQQEGLASLHFPVWDDPSSLEWIRGNAPAFDDHMKAGHLHDGAVTSMGVFPTQLVASLVGFLVFGLLLFYRRYKKFDGEVLLLFVVTYSIFRFSIEFVRGDLSRGVGWFGTALSTSQLLAIILVFVAGVGWYMLSKRPTVKP